MRGRLTTCLSPPVQACHLHLTSNVCGIRLASSPQLQVENVCKFNSLEGKMKAPCWGETRASVVAHEYQGGRAKPGGLQDVGLAYQYGCLAAPADSDKLHFHTCTC